MATTMLTFGPVHTIAQNVSNALPGRRLCKIRSSAALESSMDESTWAAITLTNNEAECSAPFIRTTAATALVRITQM